MIRSHAVALALALLLAACGSAPDQASHADAHADEHADADADAHEDEHADEHADTHDDSQSPSDAGHAHHEEHDAHTTIPADIAEEAGIRVAAAAAGTIADEHVVQGLLTPVEGRVASVTARFPGLIRALTVRVGDRVRAGQTLAVIESNLSLSDYEVKAPIAGTVLARHATLGAVASEAAPLYEVADLSTLWVDLHVFGTDTGHFMPDMPVEITRLSDSSRAQTRIERLLPGVATASQSTIARASIDNDDGLWRPGAAVQARITVDQQAAAVIVPLTALQSMAERDVVFVREGEVYEARSVQLGQRDARNAQVLAGIGPGELVVVQQSYLVKADIEKAGASHEH